MDRSVDPLPASRALWQIDCGTMDRILEECLGEEDLRILGVWEEGPSPCGLPGAVGCRAEMHAECHESTPLGRAVADLLDGRHFETVRRVRSIGEGDLAELVEICSGAGVSSDFQALLWALLTDPRPGVYRLGRSLACGGCVGVDEAAAREGRLGGAA